MYLSVSQAAAELGCRPRDISDLFYQRLLDPDRTILIAGRRAIPREYLPDIRRVLKERAGRVNSRLLPAG